MVRILHYPLDFRSSGEAMYATEHWRYMDKSRFICDFAVLNAGFLVDPFFQSTGSRLYYITPADQARESAYFNRLGKIVDEGKYDVVHFHIRRWSNKEIKALKLFGQKRVPCILLHAHCAGAAPEQAKVHKKLLQSLHFPASVRLAACAPEAAHWMFGKNAAKAVILKNAVDTNRFVYSQDVGIRFREQYASAYPTRAGTLVVLHAGRFDLSQKNQLFARAVCDEIRITRPCSFICLGAGEDYSEIAQWVQKKPLENDLSFEENTMESWYCAADALLLPSNFDGVPRAALEAQSCGLPCFVSDKLPEEVRQTGLLTKLPLSASPARWAEEILKRCPDKHRQSQGQVLRGAGYDVRTSVRELEKIYAGEGPGNASK